MKCCSCDQTPSHHYYLHPHLSLSTSRWQLLVALLGDSLAIKACSFPWNLDCFDVPCPLHSVIAAQKMRLSYISFFVRRWVVKVLPWGHFGKLSLITLKLSWNSQLTSNSEQHLSSSGITMKEWYGGNIFGPLYILNFQTNISKC